jgi:hypothetical protein
MNADRDGQRVGGCSGSVKLIHAIVQCHALLEKRSRQLGPGSTIDLEGNDPGKRSETLPCQPSHGIDVDKAVATKPYDHESGGHIGGECHWRSENILNPIDNRNLISTLHWQLMDYPSYIKVSVRKYR